MEIILNTEMLVHIFNLIGLFLFGCMMVIRYAPEGGKLHTLLHTDLLGYFKRKPETTMVTKKI